MIYAVTALIFGIFNIEMLGKPDDRFLMILATSILVVTRYVAYIHLAGYALLEANRIKAKSGRIAFSLVLITIALLANAAFFLYRFGLRNMSVAAVSAGCLITSGIIISHLIASRHRGLSRSRLMRMVSGVLIALGSADICITRFGFVAPMVGLITLFFGIYTERKSLALAFKQTVAAASSAGGAGIAVYYLRGFIDPTMVAPSIVQPMAAVGIGAVLGIAGIGYYIYSRRMYSRVPVGSSWDYHKGQR